MSALTEYAVEIPHQIIRENGKPAFAVIPYEKFKDLQERLASTPEPEEVTIPHEIVKATVIGGKTIIKAWREYLGKTQQEVADQAGMKQPQYARYENDSKANPRKVTLAKIAQALGLTIDHLEI